MTVALRSKCPFQVLNDVLWMHFASSNCIFGLYSFVFLRQHHSHFLFEPWAFLFSICHRICKWTSTSIFILNERRFTLPPSYEPPKWAQFVFYSNEPIFTHLFVPEPPIRTVSFGLVWRGSFRRLSPYPINASLPIFAPFFLLYSTRFIHTNNCAVRTTSQEFPR